MKADFLPLLVAALALFITPALAIPVGERHLTASDPSAGLRDAEHRNALRITIWYPAKEGSREAGICT
ncbi:MAG TPA: hypothetical protein VKB67_13785 [Rhizomicrobium sp.]|nr:hypothetical protein [Rhizomicrobium sp.]